MSKNKITSIVEQEKNGLVATTYVKDTGKMIAGKEEAKEDCLVVSILKQLRNLITPDKLMDTVTSKYIIEKLGLKGTEAKEVSKHYEFDNFTLKDIDDEIEKVRIAIELNEYKLSSEENKNTFIEKASNIEIDVTKGMVCVLQMPSWGVEGGVYAIKIMTNTERKWVIKLTLKYLDKETEEYVNSEYITVKLSELVYQCDGTDAVKKNMGKMRKLMDYSPDGYEELDYKKLYVALCLFHKMIDTRVVESSKLSFDDVYRVLIEEIFTLNNPDIYRKNYYILNSSELAGIAKKTGYTSEGLASLFQERGFLETDKDKVGRQQKTVTRDRVKNKYYCVRTRERFHELCDAKREVLSLTKKDYSSLEEKYSELMGMNKAKQVEDKSEKVKPKKSKKVMNEW